MIFWWKSKKEEEQNTVNTVKKKKKPQSVQGRKIVIYRVTGEVHKNIKKWEIQDEDKIITKKESKVQIKTATLKANIHN